MLVATFGALLRFDRLGTPKAIVFDETYYAKDALSLITYGVERTFLGTSENPIADQRLMAGRRDLWATCAPDNLDPCASYVAHPPLGKWLIGVGEWLWGADPFGWRFAAAVLGSLSILLVARVARRMTRSTLLGCLAGLLLALDGLHFVLSRAALLDVFLMFWVLAGFGCLVVDRDRARERLARWYEGSSLSGAGPWLGVRPWRIGAGVCLGAAVATKWSGVFFLVAFAVMSLVWDAGARRAVGLRRPFAGALRRDVPTALAGLGLVPVVVYVASWAGWFATPYGYGRNWAQATSSGWSYWVFSSVRSWIDYQIQVLGYHTGLDQSHPYQSWPWQWPLLLRPVAFHYVGGAETCGAPSCAQAVLGVGTPVIWYGALIALIGLIAWYVATRDWRAGAVLLAYAVGWLPWFYYAIADKRTMFLFYMAPMLPFMAIALALGAGLLIGRASPQSSRRVLGAAVVGSFTLLALINFWWLYPVITAEDIPYDDWHRRMFFPSWI
ncbi:dolichyl-phosphate-mannose--protein O-mannosyl transferase [Sphaerisporangium siamense]|uniref:Polyprenol-phosphate-mannose--protein mannosyltransferase n=1 Tax=Sphaerisporangium siamense TaxID=795645 RepID=A0A7W7G9N3_9ACTN|nr:phospholipid carrier-dependent glycosyltransferase [Sphaerisporangium siamense]MBB4700704.1 dolichyl-phosphate-mannose--protein O-mannosyl transferase [Sphaerisporangium siamense]